MRPTNDARRYPEVWNLRRLYIVALVALLASSSAATFDVATHPAWNLDGLFYAALMNPEPASAAKVHAGIYSEIEQHVPAYARAALTGGSTYRVLLRTSPDVFALQLPFYASKPLYCWLGRFVAKTGVSPVNAPHVISAACFAAISLLLPLLAYRAGADLLIASTVAALAIWLPELRELGAIATPDALATALVLSAMLFFLKCSRLGSGFAIAATLTRPDASLIILGVLCALWQRESKPALRRELVITGAVVAFTAALAIRFTGGYGWSTVLRHTFIERITDPAGLRSETTFPIYLKALGRGLRGHMTAHRANVLPHLAVAAIVVYFALKRKDQHSARTALLFLYCVWAATALRFLAMPLAADRLFAPAYLCTFAFGCVAISWHAREGTFLMGVRDRAQPGGDR